MTVRMRHTRGQTGSRRSHHALEEARFSKCSQCGKEHVRHTICQQCGTYRGRMVIDMKAREEKLLIRKTNKLKEMGEEPTEAKVAST